MSPIRSSVQVPQGTAPEPVTGDTTASLRAAVTSLEYRLAEREEELNTTREGLTNLQDVLEDFQIAREMERRAMARPAVSPFPAPLTPRPCPGITSLGS